MFVSILDPRCILIIQNFSGTVNYIFYVISQTQKTTRFGKLLLTKKDFSVIMIDT